MKILELIKKFRNWFAHALHNHLNSPKERAWDGSLIKVLNIPFVAIRYNFSLSHVWCARWRKMICRISGENGERARWLIRKLGLLASHCEVTCKTYINGEMRKELIRFFLLWLRVFKGWMLKYFSIFILNFVKSVHEIKINKWKIEKSISIVYPLKSFIPSHFSS